MYVWLRWWHVLWWHVPIKKLLLKLLPIRGARFFFNDAMNFDWMGGTNTLVFTTNRDWIIKVSSTVNGSHWCTVYQTEGKAGTAYVDIFVDVNEEYDDRNVSLTIQAGDLTRTVVVTQKQRRALTLTTNRFEVPQEGETIQVEVKSNISYEVTIPDYCKDWITQQMPSRGLSSSTLTFDIAASEEYDKRQGEIIIHGEDMSEVVNVYQSGGAILLLSQNVYEIGREGGLIQAEIKSNFDFDFDFDITADWVSTSYSRSMSSHTIYFTVFANDMYEDRQTDIVFYQWNSDIRDTLTIYQGQRDAFLPNVKEYCFSKEGGQVKHLFQSNVSYEAKVPGEYSWISIPRSRGLEDRSLTINVAKNASDAVRSGYIVLNSATGTINDTIRIYQGTSLALQVGLPGTLSSLIDQSGVDKWNITDLTLSGSLNGADIKCIREMAGGFDSWVNNWNLLPTKGHLASLDISDCRIVCSNEPYYNSSIISNNDCLSRSMFSNLSKLRRIILPNSVVKMEESVLSGCYALAEVTLPQSLVSMESCFNNCSSLKEIFIPDNVKTIGSIFGCSSLETVNINNAVFKYDYENPFSLCPGLKNIIVSDRNPNHVCIDGVLYTKESNKLLCYPNLKTDRSYKIKNGTKAVVRSAFQGNQYIESLTMPNSVVEIGEFAFSNTSLKNVSLSNSLKRLEFGVFYLCLLEAIDVPEGIEYINDAFQDCERLKVIYLPSTIKSAGSSRAFEGCNLSEIHCRSKLPIQIDWVSNWLSNLGNPIIYVPKGSKELYENANYWKDYEIREE